MRDVANNVEWLKDIEVDLAEMCEIVGINFAKPVMCYTDGSPSMR